MLKGVLVFLCCLMLVLVGQANKALAHCDFNNDGFDDLAIGATGEDQAERGPTGAVSVLYGTSDGLKATNNQFWSPISSLGLSDVYFFGQALACGDFNSDGRDDLAIGAPRTVINGRDAGAVFILYASSTGRLSATGYQFWSQDSPGLDEEAEFNDAFGSSLASGDFNGDGIGDLAIGVHDESVGSILTAGAVHILYGTHQGLSADQSQFFTQDNTGLDPSEQGDLFGTALVAGDFGKDQMDGCYDDLAIGIPAQTIGGKKNSGALEILYGSATGLSPVGDQLWTLNTDGIIGASLTNDQFGDKLAAGSLRGLGSVCGKKLDDLAIGAPLKTIDSIAGAGAVWVFYATDQGLTAEGNQRWSQNSPGIQDSSEKNDAFGFSLAIGQAGTGAYLAVGAVDESIGTKQAAGVVHVLYADPSNGRLTSTGNKLYSQDTPGIQDKVEAFDRFGASLATGNFDGTGPDDLVVGVPDEDVDVAEAGAVHYLRDADTAFTRWFHENGADMKDVEEENDLFGFTLAP